ncbi:hypothetical protein HYC85_005911 [Camellia sinensis]|uniref:Uncharacterized protein n=1 Tax=Camellia sinensis TaxID=4442 RepID=A0A7J7I2K0_CAMSI|nr:hypothetical protein HYC85_005911 [Camellia sinensis]
MVESNYKSCNNFNCRSFSNDDINGFRLRGNHASEEEKRATPFMVESNYKSCNNLNCRSFSNDDINGFRLRGNHASEEEKRATPSGTNPLHNR